MFNRRTILLGIIFALTATTARANPNLTDLEDVAVDLQFPAVVNYWATWCAPCIKELPDLEQLASALNGQARVYLVNFGESTDTIRRFQEKRPELFGPLAIQLKDAAMAGLQTFGLTGVPTTVLIDHQGQVVEAIQGIKPWADAAVVADIRAKILPESQR